MTDSTKICEVAESESEERADAVPRERTKYEAPRVIEEMGLTTISLTCGLKPNGDRT